MSFLNVKRSSRLVVRSSSYRRVRDNATMKAAPPRYKNLRNETYISYAREVEIIFLDELVVRLLPKRAAGRGVGHAKSNNKERLEELLR